MELLQVVLNFIGWLLCINAMKALKAVLIVALCLVVLCGINEMFKLNWMF